MLQSTLTSKGQITLPKALRDSLHLKAGDRLIFEESEDGGIFIKPRNTDVRVLKGLLKHNGPPLSIEEMDEAMAKGMSERNI